MTTATTPAGVLAINVVELNPHAPRPFVFTELALCLRDSIQAAGFVSNLYVNRTDPNGISLVLGAVPPLLGPLEQLDPRKTIIFNLEQLASTSAMAGAEYRQWLRKWLVVDYHSLNVDYLKRENGSGQQVLELPVVPGPSIVFPPGPPAGKSVDVLFYGTLSERRLQVVQRLRAAGVTVETVAGAYGDELTPAIRRARIVLNVHFYETGLFPVARMLQPVANGVPVVCETSAFSNLSDWSRSGIVFAGYDGLADACARLLRSEGEQRERALQAQRFAAQLDFATPFALVLEMLAARLAQRPPLPRNAALAASEDGELLSTAEIEALLEREADALPPESHLQPPPVPLAQRQLGQGKYGVWAVWLLVLFSLYTIWQSMR
ncbi:MAG: hypothetical protein JWQ07_3041 [Ramlibacter sp.]|nr:hypothetical protein [Ramlibacter sp.]